MNNFSSKVLLTNVKTCIAYSGTKLRSQWQIKDQTKKDHQYDLVNYAKCPEKQCIEDYTGTHLTGHVKDQSDTTSCTM